ncbi:T9SS type A sorting domain-containing protein [Bernardetia sp. OM2101]|uniref:T9SS type A sorting domain-containing protein n=1 Tax=Bernardetia sp. OM2101 TaxID=3344876 RepID=UPI0035D00144
MRYSHLIFCLYLFLNIAPCQAQNNDICSNASPFCAGSTIVYPANTGNNWWISDEVNYGCLASQPNPAWFFSKISIPGYHKISISSIERVDIDVAVWGPFPPNTSLATICATLNSGTIAPTNCSYSASSFENLEFTSITPNEIWIMLITNFSNEETDIKVNQTDGNGLMDCNILPCLDVQFSGSEQVCLNSTTTSTYSATATNSTSIIYSIFPSNAGTINSSTGVVTWNQSFEGTATVKAKAFYTGCSPIEESLNVDVFSTFELSLSVSEDTVCMRERSVFIASPKITGATYKFYVNGFSMQESTSNIFTPFLQNNDVVNVIFSKGGCTETSNSITMQVTENITPQLFLSASKITICKDEEITFTATEGLLNYDFRVNNISIQNGSSNIFTSHSIANNDTITVFSDNGTCPVLSNSIRIFVNDDFDLTLLVSDTLICEGDEITFTANPTLFRDYDFRVNGKTQQKDHFDTFVTKSLIDGDIVDFQIVGLQCDRKSNSIQIRVKPTPKVTLSASKTILFEDETVTFIAKLSNTTLENTNYTFKINGQIMQKGSSNIFITNTLHHNDKIEVEVTKDKCQGSNAFIMVSVLKEPLGIYPNPTPNQFIYNVPIEIEENYQIRLFDAIGRLIWEETRTKQGKLVKGIVNLQKQAQGMYIFQVSNSDKVMNFKVIKE